MNTMIMDTMITLKKEDDHDDHGHDEDGHKEDDHDMMKDMKVMLTEKVML